MSRDGSAKGAILAAIRAANIRQPAPPPADDAWRHSLDLPRAGLVARLAERLADYGVGLTRLSRARARQEGAIADAVAACLAAHDATSLIVPPGVPAAWRPPGIALTEDDGLLAHTAIDRIDAVLTGAACAIAESGSIVLDHRPDQGRRALTVLPRVHVCVLDAADVVGLLPEALARLGTPRLLTFISGPSATADIEFERVVGVHGPRFLEVVLTG